MNTAKAIERAKTIYWNGHTDYYSGDLFALAQHVLRFLEQQRPGHKTAIAFAGKIHMVTLSQVEDLNEALYQSSLAVARARETQAA